MLAIQIAAGIVLAVLALRFWRQGLLAAAGLALLAVLGLLSVWAYDALVNQPDSKAASLVVVVVAILLAGVVRGIRKRSLLRR